jgi:Uri superfamily endonuclease
VTDQPGAYVLLVALRAPLALVLPGRRQVVLPTGWYLYCGSAYGPGGLRARLRRHMQRGKKLKWHIDRLTEAGHAAGAWVVPGGNECLLVEAMSHLPCPAPGFGSSNCRTCRNHLLRWPGGPASDIWGKQQGLSAPTRHGRLRPAPCPTQMLSSANHLIAVDAFLAGCATPDRRVHIRLSS